MADIRTDPISGARVIYAPERAGRTSDYHLHQPEVESLDACPFCPGHEHETPAEVDAVRSGSEVSGWQWRVFPNKFPALREPDGCHEVIVESPDHEGSLAAATAAQVKLVLEGWQKRIRARSGKRGIRSVVIFKNQGAAAGATRVHPHSQMVGLPFVPPRLEREVRAAARWRRARRGCPWCASANASPEREVYRNASYLLVCPDVSRFAMETWLLPARHESGFEEARDLDALALALLELLRRIDRALRHPPFNLVLMTAPFGGGRDYHWRIELIPRVGNIAGFEWASGCYINAMPPEEAARVLRASG